MRGGQITATGEGVNRDEVSLEIVRSRSGVASRTCLCRWSFYH